jgi:S-adenosylmethionine/arginine decarboxylase-like enzyme
MASYYESITELIKYRMNPDIKKVVINTSVQPNSIPHFGTITTFFCAFVFAKMVKDCYAVETEVELDFIDCCLNVDSRQHGGKNCFSIARTPSKEEHSMSVSEYHITTDYIPLLKWISAESGINYSTRLYHDFQKEAAVRTALIAICNDREFFELLLNPSDKKLQIRPECPVCYSTDKSLKKTKITDICPSGFKISSHCEDHGAYSFDISESDSNFIYMNTQLRDIVKGALMASYSNDNIIGVMFDGGDWGGAWTHHVHCKSMQRLKCQIPPRLFAPIILDWSGGKLSKSIYLDDVMTQDNPIENYKIFMEKYGDNGLLCIYKEVKEWLSDPKKFFRNYSLEHILEVLKQNCSKDMMHDFAGTHIMSEFYNIRKNLTSGSSPELVAFIRESCAKNKIRVLKDDHFIFENGGYTLFFLLEESHLSVHTYVEHKSAFIDIFTCGNVDATNILNDINAFYFPEKVENEADFSGKRYQWTMNTLRHMYILFGCIIRIS